MNKFATETILIEVALMIPAEKEEEKMVSKTRFHMKRENERSKRRPFKRY
jgi:hypothetical protein